MGAVEAELAALRITVNGLLETTASLSVRLAAAERKITDLEDPFGPPPPELVYSRPAEYRTPTFVKAKLTRDDVIERAKADVAELLRIGRDDFGELPKGDYSGTWFDADFVINREKRTVVALVHGLNGFHHEPYPRKPNGPHSKGIAKAAPGDVFNVHIGKALSLRRALGLEVPPEYTNAPAPTEVRVGDIVEYDFGHTTKKLRVIGWDRWAVGDECRIDSMAATGRIIDDSREEVSV